jgi:hypothetical protein
VAAIEQLRLVWGFGNARAKLRFMLAVQHGSSRWHMANPSIEGMPKRLRLLGIPSCQTLGVACIHYIATLLSP